MPTRFHTLYSNMMPNLKFNLIGHIITIYKWLLIIIYLLVGILIVIILRLCLTCGYY